MFTLFTMSLQGDIPLDMLSASGMIQKMERRTTIISNFNPVGSFPGGGKQIALRRVSSVRFTDKAEFAYIGHKGNS